MNDTFPLITPQFLPLEMSTVQQQKEEPEQSLIALHPSAAGKKDVTVMFLIRSAAAPVPGLKPSLDKQLRTKQQTSLEAKPWPS